MRIGVQDLLLLDFDALLNVPVRNQEEFLLRRGTESRDFPTLEPPPQVLPDFAAGKFLSKALSLTFTISSP
jgi:hypothetical protein